MKHALCSKDKKMTARYEALKFDKERKAFRVDFCQQKLDAMEAFYFLFSFCILMF